MKFGDLFIKYGIASLFGVTRYLHSEVERLQLRVWQLENRLYESHQPQGEIERGDYEDLDAESNLDEGWFSGITEVPFNSSEKNEVYGRSVKPRNIRRTVDDLMREAKAAHNAEHETRAYKEALAQEEALGEMLEPTLSEDTRPVDVVVSDAKKNFLIEAGKAVMQSKMRS